MSDVVDSVRAFNRFYTKTIGVLPEGHLESEHSLAEVRVLYELAHRNDPTATEVATDLGLDAGYMSRILRKFEKSGLLARKTSERDARQSLLALTKKGRTTVAAFETRSRNDITALLASLSATDQRRVINAMQTVQRLLGDQISPSVPFVIRPPHAGDMGWVVARHGALYAEEYGWNEEFEALVAEIVANFMKSNDPKRERAWIAERDGENVGSVFLVKKSATIAKLRLLLVEPSARGLGIGRKLVEECTRFARQAGYKKVVLWTQSNLTAARAIYAKAGYELVAEEPNHSFGHDLVSETWELKV